MRLVSDGSAVVANRMVRGRDDRALDLHRSPGGDDGRGQQRGHVADSAPERPDGRSPRATAGRAARDGGAAARRRRPSTSASAETETELCEQAERPERRSQRRQIPTDPPNLAAELPAPVAVAQVPSRHPVRADAAVMGDDQLLADLRARSVAGLGRLREADASAHQQRLHRRDGHR